MAAALAATSAFVSTFVNGLLSLLETEILNNAKKQKTTPSNKLVNYAIFYIQPIQSIV